MGASTHDGHAPHAAPPVTALATVPSAPRDPGAPYQVRLPGFEGPLDLLLHLIERDRWRSRPFRSLPSRTSSSRTCGPGTSRQCRG